MIRLFYIILCFLTVLPVLAQKQDCLAPPSQVNELNYTLDFSFSELEKTDADLIVIATTKDGLLDVNENIEEIRTRPQALYNRFTASLGRDLDGVFFDKVEEIHGNNAGLDFVPCGSESLGGNILVSKGLKPEQNILYIPLNPKLKQTRESALQLQQLNDRLSAALLWAQKHNKKTIAFSAIGTGVYRWPLKEILQLIKTSADKIFYKGKIKIHVQHPELYTDIQELRQKMDSQATLSPSETVHTMTMQVVNHAGIHVRPATSLIMFFNSRNIMMTRMAALDTRNQIIPDSVITELDPISILCKIDNYTYGTRVEFKLKIPEALSVQEVEMELKDLFDNFEKFKRIDGIHEDKLDLNQKLKDFTTELGIPAFKVIKDPYLAQITGYLPIPIRYFPILRYIPANPQNERLRFELVSKHLQSEEHELARKKISSQVTILGKLVSKTGILLRERPTYNTEYAISQAAGILYEQLVKDLTVNKTIDRAYFGRQTMNLFTHAEKLVSLVRSPWFYGFNTFAGQREAQRARMAADLQYDMTSLYNLCEYIENEAESLSKMKLMVKDTMNEVAVRLRETQIISWMDFSQLLENKILSFPADEKNKYLFLIKLYQLYHLGNSYLHRSFFSISGILEKIRKSSLINNAQVKNYIDYIEEKQGHYPQGKWSALDLYNFFLHLPPKLSAEELLNLFNETEFKASMEALEPNRSMVLSMERQDLESLKLLPRSLNIASVIVHSESLDIHSQYMTELRKIFPSAVISISRNKNIDISRHGNRSLLFFKGLTGEFIANPEEKDYAEADRFSRTLETLPSDLQFNFKTEAPVPLIFGHNNSYKSIGQVIHIASLLRYIESGLMPQTQQILSFLESSHSEVPSHLPFLVEIFENRTSENASGRINATIDEEETGELIGRQLDALGLFILNHPEREVVIIPQSEPDTKSYEKLVKMFTIRLNSPKITEEQKKHIHLINSVNHYNQPDLKGDVYIHMNPIIQEIRHLSENFSYNLMQYLDSLLTNPQIEQLYLVGDSLSEPPVMLYLCALNAKRINEGKSPLIMALRDNSLETVEMLLSQVEMKDLLAWESRLHRSDFSKVLPLFVEWSRQKMKETYEQLFLISDQNINQISA